MSNTIKYKGKYYPFRWQGDILQIWNGKEWVTINIKEIEK